MEYQDHYEGHRLSVWTTASDRGWIWCFSIDDDAMVQGSFHPNVPENIVLSEGIEQARKVIRDTCRQVHMVLGLGRVA